MIKVITYGTYDLLHYGHIRLLKRAKALGDYLIVGITADSFDVARGKINVRQSLIERIEAVKATGLADEIIIEEYEGQKIDDIRRFGVDIFAIGSDWKGHFEYLNEFCKVVYLDRTQGISSSELRAEKRELCIGTGRSDRILSTDGSCNLFNRTASNPLLCPEIRSCTSEYIRFGTSIDFESDRHGRSGAEAIGLFFEREI
jgi:choline-phosphate cytidylyltransferase